MEPIKLQFRNGDKVQLKSGGPVMEVLGYESLTYSDYLLPRRVECTYYCFLEKKCKVEAYYEKHLRKVGGMVPIWTILKSLFPADKGSLVVNY